MNKELVIGIDIGTHASRGVVVNKKGKVLAEALCKHNLIVPLPGQAEHDAKQWWDDFVLLTKQLLEKAGIESKDVTAVCCSAIAPTMLPLDMNGEPLRNAILYGIDTRSKNEVKELTKRIGKKKLIDVNGSTLCMQSVGPKILWYMKNEQQLFKKTRKIVTATTYLVYRLTRKFFIDHYTASAFGPMYDCNKKEWTNELCPEIPIELLPELVWADEIIGVVSKESARQTGLKAGTKVIAGTADAAAEAIGCGVVQEGDLMIMYGTSGFFIKVENKFIKTSNLWSANYLRSNKFAVLGGMSSIGAMMSWFKDLFKDVSLKELDILAKNISIGSNGLIVLPYFSGERTPINDPNARGVFFGLSLYHNKGHIFKAILESIGYGIRDNIEHMTSMGLPINRAIAIGGGVNSPILLQIVSDILNLKQYLPKNTLGACYGDAFLAYLGMGFFNSLEDVLNWVEWDKEIIPVEKNKYLYDKYYKIYKDLYKCTSKLTKELVEIPNL